MDAFLDECSWIAITLVAGREAWGWARKMPKGSALDNQIYAVSLVVEKVFEAQRARGSESSWFTEQGTQKFQRVVLEFSEVSLETRFGINVSGSGMHHSFNESDPMNAQSCVLAINAALKNNFAGVFGPFEGPHGNDARYSARAQREWWWIKNASVAWESDVLYDATHRKYLSRPYQTL